nr:cation transporter [candidate division Zixibacteria bacterium]
MTHTHIHNRSGGRLFATIILNVAITAAEFVGGLLTGYLALLADAVHNLSDVAALILAQIGETGSRRPPSKISTYGYKRLEVMTAFISAVALVIIAVYIFYEAYRRFLTPVDLSSPTLLLVIATVGLIGNILSVILLHASRSQSLNIKAAFLHMLYDTLSSLTVIIGAVVILKTGWNIIDPILSAVIGLMILWSSFDVIREATMIFLEAVPARIDYDTVANAIRMHPEVTSLHDLHIWSLSSRDVALSCHIRLEDSRYNDSPRIIREINQRLHHDFGIGHATIQPERDDCSSADIGWYNNGECL